MSAAGRFDVHGLRIRISGPWQDVVEQLRLDLAWFEAPAAGHGVDFELVVDGAPYDLSRHGDVSAWSISPRSVGYRLPDGSTVTDYLGLAASRLERGGRRLDVHGPDARLAHEAAFNGVRAAVVRHLDHRGMAPLHAVAFSGAQGAVVVLLPSGGGKSSLAVRALRADGVRLLSDDMPILDAAGMVHPFPLRIGVTAGDPALVDRVGRTIEHLGWRPKLAIEVGDLVDHIEANPVPLAHLVVATRSIGPASRLEAAAPQAARRLLVRESVLRVAAGQGPAWLTARRSLTSTARKVVPLARRAQLCRRALSSARTWRLVLGSDREGNWTALEPLLTDAGDTAAAP